MREKIVLMPSRLDSVTSLMNMKIPNLDLSNIDKCIFDFSKCTFGKPLAMLILGKLVRDQVKKYPNCACVVRTKANDFRGYADHIGFFRYMGFARGNRPGQVNGSQTHIPIVVFDLDQLREASGERPYAEIIVEKSRELASVLLGVDSGDLLALLRFVE